jgi:hypothetical protein
LKVATHGGIHGCFFGCHVYHLFNRVFHLKFFQTFYYSRGQGELFEGIF